MVRPVRIGVIGCGSVMRDGYMPIAQQLRAEGLAEVVMACDVDAALAPTIREQFAIPHFTTDYQEVLASDVDLVLVLTAPSAHGPIAQAMVADGFALPTIAHLLALPVPVVESLLVQPAIAEDEPTVADEIC